MKTPYRTAFYAVMVAVFTVSGCAEMQQKMQSASSSAQEQRTQKEAVLPQCPSPIGSVTIVPPEKNWWQAVQLQSPEALIKLYVLKSGCFTVLDRGRGFEMAQRERALAQGGELQDGSNLGRGQIRVADYVITPDIVSNNNNSDGGAIGALIGSFVPGFGGLIASQVSMNSKSANVTLAVTDVRTSEQVVMAEGRAEKTDLGFGVAGAAVSGGFSGLDFGAVGASSYKNTALGQVVAMAYLEAYAKMVARIQTLPRSAAIQ